MNLPNIYFVAKAGSGKTYCCNYLKSKYGYKQSKFAFPIYNLAYDYCDMPRNEKWRNLLQDLGTKQGRKTLSENIWVERFKEDIRIVTNSLKELYDKELHLVSDDCRFRNEHEALKSMGWLGIFLTCPTELRITRLIKRDGSAQIETLNHESELACDQFKDELIQVDSSGSLDETYANIEEVLNNLRG